MAVDHKPTTIKGWLKDNQPVTWAAHGLITIGIGLVGAYAIHTGTPSIPHVVAYAVGTTAAALGFMVKEWIDKRAHRKAGDMHKPDYAGVTPVVDGAADQLVPYAVALSAWAAVFAVWALNLGAAH